MDWTCLINIGEFITIKFTLQIPIDENVNNFSIVSEDTEWSIDDF